MRKSTWSHVAVLFGWACTTTFAPPALGDSTYPATAVDSLRLAEVVGAHTKALGDTNRDLLFTPLTPCRLIDTRGFGAPIQGGYFSPNARRGYVPQGLCNIPAANVSSLVLSFTTQNLTPASGGYIAMLAPNAAVSTTSDIFNLNSEWSASITVVPTGPAGQFDVYVATATAHVVVDVLGYFGPLVGGIGTASIADGAITTAKLAPPEAWHEVAAAGEPTFGLGWSHEPHALLGICSVWSQGCPVYAKISFRKDVTGRVYLRGAAKWDLSGGGSSVIFRLPPSHAPINDAVFRPPQAFPCDIRLNIYGGGYVQVSVPCGLLSGPYYISLDAVSFTLD